MITVGRKALGLVLVVAGCASPSKEVHPVAAAAPPAAPRAIASSAASVHQAAVPPVALPPLSSAASASAQPAAVEPAPPDESSSRVVPCESIRGRATCAGGKRCPADAPICAVTAAGAKCVACGSPQHAAVKSDDRWGCTRQSDCTATDGCFFVVGEVDFGLRTLCRAPLPEGPNPAVCDMKKDVCNGSDPSCVPCAKLDGETATHLPWVGTW